LQQQKERFIKGTSTLTDLINKNKKLVTQLKQ
jgi:hypothetical protein